ncbi:hypothetical protein K6119_05860 [Paracrocinitomix mangrovi]|uniref:DUF7793 family protein n=1 Tax=Paracrocinitomix mangrovi TaxID=2862509 RepID=UPI001C8DC032|nr:hypothetical protein [Paracrocinitomix mangrovi]UKN03040.1 hypothetical protein K6119_05860 [Paracrocinitomix mangrovi]
MEPIVNENSTIVLEIDIYRIIWKDNVRLERADVEEAVRIYDELTDGVKDLKVLHVFPKNTSITSEARQWSAKRERPAIAEAFVIHSIIHRNLFKLYRKFRSVDYPMREFSTESKALEWLNEY